MTDVAVVTASFGGYDVPHGAVEQTVDADWFAFTDDTQGFASEITPGRWCSVLVTGRELVNEPRKRAKVFRMVPWRVLPEAVSWARERDYRWIVWLDASMEVISAAVPRGGDRLRPGHSARRVAPPAPDDGQRRSCRLARGGAREVRAHQVSAPRADRRLQPRRVPRRRRIVRDGNPRLEHGPPGRSQARRGVARGDLPDDDSGSGQSPVRRLAPRCPDRDVPLRSGRPPSSSGPRPVREVAPPQAGMPREPVGPDSPAHPDGVVLYDAVLYASESECVAIRRAELTRLRSPVTHVTVQGDRTIQGRAPRGYPPGERCREYESDAPARGGLVGMGAVSTRRDRSSRTTGAGR